MPHQSGFRPGWALATCLLLGACVSPSGLGTPRVYGFDNSVSAACRTNPANCPSLTGSASTTGPGHAVATAGYTVDRVLRILDDATKASIAEALKQCAEEARAEVLLRYDGHFKSVGPTADERREWVQDARGRRVTWAMRLGLEMHEVALKCAAERLGRLRPGGFNIEPRYRYDVQTRQRRLVSPEEERALEQSGNSGELLGTIKPDIVLHTGDPLQVQVIYDFKFPCVNTDRMPEWREYAPDHPYEGKLQGDLYQEALSAEAFRVAPYIGVMP
jgi:hypothetical protein